MKHSFRILLVMCILMVIGVGLVPQLDISNEPRPEQGQTINIWFGWPNASTKVIEQLVTSRIEASVSTVKGVKNVSSVSYYDYGIVIVEMKPKADISMARFEISSNLRQMYSSLPKGVIYPIVDGGEANSSQEDDDKVKCILTYQINADMSEEQIYQLTEKDSKRFLERIEGIDNVKVNGIPSQYMEISYDANDLALYGLSNNDIIEAIKNYTGREDIVGEVSINDGNSVIPLILSSKSNGKVFEQMPLRRISDKTIYLNDLVSSKIKTLNPDSYYRINGLNSVYVNVFVKKNANVVRVSNEVKRVLKDNNTSFLSSHSSITYDRAETELKEFKTLLLRSSLTLAILLLFVWFASGMKWKYTFIISIGLLANILIAVVAYWLLNIRLHPMSIAGITISLGIIIDSTIVMVDHYSYYRNRKAFIGILAAMLTTIGALVIVFWLPDFLKHDLKDFSIVVMVNLFIAIIVASFFMPALVDRLKFSNKKTNKGSSKYARFVIRFSNIYHKYVSLCQHHIGRWAIILMVTILFGGTLYCFIECLDTNRYKPKKEKLQLSIRAKMPTGGSTKELNEKVKEVELFLSQFKEINRYATTINGQGASIIVEFKKKWEESAFPVSLERKVIAKVITIGGADWSVSGVSENGFSNSPSLQIRNTVIRITGYDYLRLYRFAEDMCDDLKKDKYIEDLAILTPGHEELEKEYYMEYKHDALAIHKVNQLNVYSGLYNQLRDNDGGEMILSSKDTKNTKDGEVFIPVITRPSTQDTYDSWKMHNSYINIGGRNIKTDAFMDLKERNAKNIIQRDNQEYSLGIAFDVMNTWNYTEKVVKKTLAKYNDLFPEGFRCIDPEIEDYKDDSTQYWLIGIVAIVIFFIISIMFESLMQAFAIILLIPASFIGLFLTYYITGVPFGTGGFAAMVMLAGLTVNAGIYIICQDNNQRELMRPPVNYDKKVALRRGSGSYVKAFNHKIIPILLTILSTILGMIPFLIDGSDDQPFWYSLAVGTIGGLMFSVIPLILFLPCVLRLRK